MPINKRAPTIAAIIFQSQFSFFFFSSLLSVGGKSDLGIDFNFSGFLVSLGEKVA